VFDVSKQQYLRTLPLDKANTLVWLRWVDDETVLYSVRFLDTYRMPGGEYRRYFTRVFAVDVPTGKRRNLLMDATIRRSEISAEVVAWHTKKPGTVVMSMYETSSMSATPEDVGNPWARGWHSRLFEVDTHTGKSANLDFATFATDEWLFDGNGTPLARREWARGIPYRILAKDGRGWRELLRDPTIDSQERPTFAGVKRDGSAIIATATKGFDRRILQAVPFDGSERTVFFADPQTEVARVETDPVSNAGARYLCGPRRDRRKGASSLP